MGSTKTSEELLDILQSAASFAQGREELKEYQITDTGIAAVQSELLRLRELLDNGTDIMGGNK